MNQMLVFWSYIFSRPIFYKFNLLLFNLSLRGMGLFNYTNFRASGEYWVIKNLLPTKRDLIIFDVGANEGSFVDQVLEIRKNVTRVFAFEPHPRAFSRLSKRFSKNKKTSLYNLALSNSTGEAQLSDYPDGDGSSHASFESAIFSEIYKSKVSKVVVELDTLDNFCKLNDIERIDFLKIDVEGHELRVLEGATDLLASKKVDIIQFEFTQLNAVIKLFFYDFYSMLSPDFEIFRLVSHGLVPIPKYDPTLHELFGYQNFVAIRKCREH